MGSPPYRDGEVSASLGPSELCRLESCTPGRVTHAGQVKGFRPDEEWVLVLRVGGWVSGTSPVPAKINK